MTREKEGYGKRIPRVWRRERVQRTIAGFFVFFSIYMIGMLATDFVVGLGPVGEGVTRTQLMYGFGWQAVGMAIALAGARRRWY